MRFVYISNNPIASSTLVFGQEFLVSNWQHRRTATVGFDAAQFDLVLSNQQAEEMFEKGLGRIVTRYSLDGNKIIWQGYISAMTLLQPGMKAQISLDNLYNRVTIKYNELDTSTNPPGETPGTFTATVNDTISQAKYGIKEIVYTPPTAKLKDTMADQLLATFLEMYREPHRSADVISSQTETSLYVYCKGYKHTLDWRIYTQTANTTTDDADAIIALMLATADLYVTGSSLTANTTAVNKYFADRETIWTLINHIATLGDSSNNRWIAYVNKDRTLVYEQAGSTIVYFRRLSDPAQSIYDTQGRLVPPWEIEPNKWLITTEIEPFKNDPALLRDNPRAMYIESVSWTERDNRTVLSGSRGDEVSIMVARASNIGEILL